MVYIYFFRDFFPTFSSSGLDTRRSLKKNMHHVSGDSSNFENIFKYPSYQIEEGSIVVELQIVQLLKRGKIFTIQNKNFTTYDRKNM